MRTCARTPNLKHLVWMVLILLTQLVACGGGGTTSTEPMLLSIAVTPANPTIGKGSTLQFTAIGNYSNNTTGDITTSADWGTSNSNIATVSNITGNKGLATGVNEGSVNITASLNGISGSSNLAVVTIGLVYLSLLDSFDAILGYINHPAVALNDQGMVLVAYAKDLRESGQDKALLTKFYDGNTWPPSWQSPAAGISNYWPSSNPTHQLVMNESGAAGMIYDVTLDHLNKDWFRFGVAYFNGATWNYTLTLEGEIQQPFYEEVRTPIVGIDSTGVMYVAYRKVLSGFPQDVLAIARFSTAGLIDVTEFPELVGNLYLSINANNQVMVLNTASGSRTFDGTTWGQLKPLTLNLDPAAYLKLSNSGSAEFIALFNAITHFHYDGTSWGAGVRINDSFSAGNGDAAVNGSGHIMVAYQGSSMGPLYHIQANYFNGTSWSPPNNVDNTDGPEGAPRVMVDGLGNFVAIYEDIAALHANYFDGSWHTPTTLDGVYGGATAMNQNGDIVIVSGGCGLFVCELYSSFLEFYP